MAARVVFFPVSNGDMTLIELDNGQCILTDINIRAVADNEDDETPDVAEMLRKHLNKRGRDDNGRLFVDTFCLSHPDQDHITGLRNHFHLGPLEDWSEDDDKIVVREMWSSPVVFRRASKNNRLCDDAKAWNKEAKRRVKRYRDVGITFAEGDRILILGEDEDGRTDDIPDIVVKIDKEITKSNRENGKSFNARLLGPLPATDDEDSSTLVKNRSSIVLRFSLHIGGQKDKCRILTGGDAEVEIWKRLWNKHKDENLGWLEYDILQSPHHCSWRSLSFDSWSEKGKDAKTDQDARSALSQCRDGAVIVASSKEIKDDDDNPPHHRAKEEYISIVESDDTRFYCTDEEWDSSGQPLVFDVESAVKKRSAKAAAIATKALGIGATAAAARPHG